MKSVGIACTPFTLTVFCDVTAVIADIPYVFKAVNDFKSALYMGEYNYTYTLHSPTCIPAPPPDYISMNITSYNMNAPESEPAIVSIFGSTTFSNVVTSPLASDKPAILSMKE